MNVLARVPKFTNESKDAGELTSSLIQQHSCHPYFGGVHLNDGADMDATAAVRRAGTGNLIPLATVHDVASRAEMRQSVPFALLDMSHPWGKLGELVKAWKAVDSYDAYDEEALHVQVDGCSSDIKDRWPEIPRARPQELQFPSIASRFAAFASVAFGAQTVVHTGIGHKGCTQLHTRREGVKVINKPAPPMLLIVDARREGLRKGVNVTLQSNTYSWTPLVFDDRAGATSCDA